MDLSNLQKATSNLSINDSNCKDEGNEFGLMKVAPAKRLYFSPPTFRQNWSFPDSIIYYITMTPSSTKGYQKTIQSCKYFFSKNPIIVCSGFEFADSDHTYENEKNVPQIVIDQDRQYAYIRLENLFQKFWITDRCFINVDDVVKNGNILSKVVIPHIYRFEAKFVALLYQIISFAEFKLLAKNLDSFYFLNLIVKNEDGTVVPLEKLVEVADKAKEIEIRVKEDADPMISSKTVKNLLQIPHFATMDSFCLWGIPEAFDIETFFAYIKENKHTEIYLHFSSQLSDQYKARLDAIIDEICSADTQEYKTPIITFR